MRFEDPAPPLRPLAPPLGLWRESPSVGRRLVGLGSSNTELTWHNDGAFSWFAWLGATIRAEVGKHVIAIDAGISGDTSADLLQRLERDVRPLQPDLVLITIGGNDHWKLQVSDFGANLRSIARRLQGIGCAPVFQTDYCPAYGPAHLESFARYMDEIRGAAFETGAGLLDPFPRFRRWWERDPHNYRSLLLRDELHLNPLGHAAFGALAAVTFGLPFPLWPQALAPSARAALDTLYLDDPSPGGAS